MSSVRPSAECDYQRRLREVLAVSSKRERQVGGPARDDRDEAAVVCGGAIRSAQGRATPWNTPRRCHLDRRNAARSNARLKAHVPKPDRSRARFQQRTKSLRLAGEPAETVTYPEPGSSSGRRGARRAGGSDETVTDPGRKKARAARTSRSDDAELVEQQARTQEELHAMEAQEDVQQPRPETQEGPEAVELHVLQETPAPGETPVGDADEPSEERAAGVGTVPRRRECHAGRVATGNSTRCDHGHHQALARLDGDTEPCRKRICKQHSAQAASRRSRQ